MIFICYRSQDAGTNSDLVYNELLRYFRKKDVYLGSERKNPGEDFSERIETKAKASKVMLVLIGPEWLNAKNQENGQLRIQERSDWVRREIEIGLDLIKSKDKWLIPIFLPGREGISLEEKTSLPTEIRQLADLDGLKLRKENDLRRDLHEIVKVLRKRRAARRTMSNVLKRWFIVLFAIIAPLAFVTTFALTHSGPRNPQIPATTALVFDLVDLTETLVDGDENIRVVLDGLMLENPIQLTEDEVMTLNKGRFEIRMPMLFHSQLAAPQGVESATATISLKEMNAAQWIWLIRIPGSKYKREFAFSEGTINLDVDGQFVDLLLVAYSRSSADIQLPPPIKSSVLFEKHGKSQ